MYQTHIKKEGNSNISLEIDVLASSGYKDKKYKREVESRDVN